jgi:uncharacterized membrane protein
MLFLVPLLGAVMGAAAEALSDTGVNDDFMREVSTDLRPGAAAVFALVKPGARGQGRPRDRAVPWPAGADLAQS